MDFKGEDGIPDFHWKEPLPNIAAEEFRKVVMTRRSVRIFESSSIPEEITQDCLNMGLLAPNSDNLQPWEFYWVKSPEKKSQLVQICLNQPAARTAAELIVCVARPDTWPNVQNQIIEQIKQSAQPSERALKYYRVNIPRVYSQGFLGWFGLFKRIQFFLRGLKNPTAREPVTRGDMKLWAAKSTSLAGENIMLAFRAYGYDTCPMEGFDSRRIKKLLNLPRRSFVTMVIAAGRRAPNGIYGPRYRFNRSQFIKIV